MLALAGVGLVVIPFVMNKMSARPASPARGVSYNYDAPAAPRTVSLSVRSAGSHMYDHRAQGSRLGIAAIGRRLDAEGVGEGIYVIRGAAETYVGQSGNVANRLAPARWQDRAREIAEQNKIDDLGASRDWGTSATRWGPSASV